MIIQQSLCCCQGFRCANIYICLLRVPSLDAPRQGWDYFCTEVAGSWIHQVEVAEEVLFKGIEGAIGPVARRLKYFLMKSLDDLMVVNLNDPAAAWGFRIESKHSELTVGLTLAVGNQEILQISCHEVVGMNE